MPQAVGPIKNVVSAAKRDKTPPPARAIYHLKCIFGRLLRLPPFMLNCEILINIPRNQFTYACVSLANFLACYRTSVVCECKELDTTALLANDKHTEKCILHADDDRPVEDSQRRA